MKHILTIFVLLSLCGSAFAQPAPAVFLKWDDDGNAIFNKRGDSLFLYLINGSDTSVLWISSSGIYWNPSTLLDSLFLDSMRTAAGRFDDLDSGAIMDIIGDTGIATGDIINATLLFEDWAQNAASANQVAVWTGSVWEAQDQATGGTGGWTDQDPHIILEAIDDSVGIGTASPDAKLEVVGEIKTDTLIVTEDITLPDNSISDEELDEGAAFLWTGGHQWNAAAYFADNLIVYDGVGDSPFFSCRDGDSKHFLISKYDAGYSRLYNNEAEIRFHFSDDGDDYIYFDTSTANVPMISTGGDCDMVINASSGEISLGDENLTTTGTLDAGATSVTGNITVTGTVDTVDLAALGATVPKITDDTTDFKTAYDSSQNLTANYMDTDGDTVTGTYDFSDGDIVDVENLDADTIVTIYATRGTKAVADSQYTTKKYVDDNIAAAGGGDVTDVVGGDGLVDDGNTGSITLDVKAGYGIVIVGDSVEADTATLKANMIVDSAVGAERATYADSAGSSADEKVQDKVGAMFTDSAHSQITAVYDDAGATVELALDNPVDSADGSERATKDGDGSTISTTYMKRSGALAVTGNQNWGDQNLTNVEIGDFDTLAVESLGVSSRFEIGGDKFTDLTGSGLEIVAGALTHTAHTGDVTGTTALTIAANAVESTMIGADQVNDLDINFGTGTDQVSTTDIPEGTNKYETFDSSAAKIRAKPISKAAPTDNYILKFDAAKDSFMLEVDAGAAGGTTDSTYINDGVQYGPFTNDMYKILEGAGINIVREDSTSYDVFKFQATLGTSVDLTSEVTGTLPVNKGGSGASNLTDHALIVGSGTDPVSNIGVMSSGQIPIGVTGADPVAAAPSAGEAIDISLGAGSITISAEDATSANKGVVTLAAIRAAGDTAAHDTADVLRSEVQVEIEDSLDEYSLTSAIASLYPDTAEVVDTIQGVLTEGGYLTGNESITLSGDVSGSGATAITTTIGASKVDSNMLNSTEVDEYIQDKAGAMDGGTETRISVTYNDGTGEIDYVVDDMNDDVPEAGDYTALTGGHGITHDPTGTVKVDTAVAVADAETKPVTGNAVWDFCETTKNYALNSELHTRSHTMTSTSDHTAGNYKLFHSDGSGEVQELAHGASAKVLTSGGASSAPTWETPTAGFNWQDSAGEPPFWVDSAKYATTTGSISDAFVAGKLTVTGPIDRYNIKLELDTTNIYCAHADTFLRLPIDTSSIGAPEDTFQMMHPSIVYIPEGKWGYKYWLACTPPNASPIKEDIHILVSNDEVTWTEFVSGSDTLYNPVFKAADFDSAIYTSDPDMVWDENGDLHLVFRVSRINVTDSPTVHYLYCASTNDGIDWTDTMMIIDGFYDYGTGISPKWGSLDLLSPGLIMRGAGDYFMYTSEDTGSGSPTKWTRVAWEAPRIDTLWRNVSGFDSTILFGTIGPFMYDTIRISIVHQTFPDGNVVFHADEIVYGTDLIVNLVGTYDGVITYPAIYMGISTDGEYFTSVSTPLLDTINNLTAWDHNILYRASGYFVVRNGKVILRMYYCGEVDGDWYTGLTNVYFGDVLNTKELLIWNPDIITDTVPIFEADSADYPGGIEIYSVAVQTSEDGTYALKFFSYTAADPPVLHDYIDTLNVGASDQRASSILFEDDDSPLIDRGQSMYILTPSTDIDWIKVKYKFFVRDWLE